MKRKFQKFSVLAVLVVFLFSFAPDIVESRRGFGADGVSGVAVVIVAARVDGVTHRDALIVAPAAGVVLVALTVAQEREVIRVHGLQHLAQHVARAAPTTEAVHREAQVHVQVVQPARSRLLPVVPEPHQLRQHATPRLHAASNGR